MRNLMRVALIVFIVASTLCLPSFSVTAAGTAIVSVSVPAQPVSPGTQFTVNITVEPNNAIAGVQFNLSFNPSLITVNSVSEGNLLKQGGANTYFMPGTTNNTAGTVTGVAGAITTPGQTVSTSGTFATITFTAGTTKGTSTLNLSNVIVGDINGQSLGVNVVNGQVSTDRPPVLNTIGNKTVNEGSLLTFTITATDADGDALTYSASNLPTGASFNTSTHTFSWTPTYNQAGSYPNVHFQISDGSLTASEDIAITVNEVNQLTVITDIASGITATGATLNGNLTSKGSDASVNVSFEYGLTTNYGINVVGVPATITTPGTFTFNLTGLTSNTLYHYRAKAVGNESVFGLDQTFSTSTTQPTVVTNAASGITISGATLNANLTGKGNAPTVTVSFEYGLTSNYGSTVAGVPVTLNAPGTFIASIDGLTPNTQYHYRAKAAGDGTVYGSDSTFTTINPAPVVATAPALGITTTGATLVGNLSNKGNSSSVVVSFEYGLTTNYGNTVTGVPATLIATGTFTASLAGLTSNTPYHYRAKVVGNETVYGLDQTFTTTSATQPIVITDSASGVTATLATLNGSLTGASTVAVSFEYGMTTTYGNTAVGVPATLTTAGTFSANITGLNPNTVYHYRAKAVGNDTIHGTDQTFTTAITAPIVVTNAASNITSGSATLNGNLSVKGSASTVTVGFEYGLTTNYESIVDGNTASLVDPSAFAANLTGLTSNTLYHYRAKATSNETVYGIDQTFTTNVDAPIVVTDAPSGIAANGAILGAHLMSKGSASTLIVSFEYGMTTNYGHSVTGVSSTLNEAGTFTANITGLKANTLYHYRAKAIGDSTAYGLDQTFTTISAQLVVTTIVSPSTTTSKPEIELLGVVRSHSDEISKMGETTSARITFWISNPSPTSEIKPVLVVELNEEPLEEITNLNLAEPEAEGTVGNYVYMPSEGWKPGIYNFYLKLVGPEGVLCESEEQSLNVKPATFINWSILLVVISVGIGVSLVLTCVLLIRKRLYYR